jgi:flagellar basal body-associated protein FliL
MIMAIIGITIIAIVGIQHWGDAQQYKAEQAKAEAQAMENLADAMETIQSTVNTQQLQIKLMLEQGYGTKNLQPIIKEVNADA